MQTRLNKLLTPQFITTRAADVFEETLLKAAGITTRPTSCRFDMNDETFYLKISGLTPDDAKQFLQFLKDCGDENAALILKDGKPCFTMQTYLVQDKLMENFERQFSALPKEVIAKYRNESKSDVIIANKIREVLGANNFDQFKLELKKLLAKKYISEPATGIFTKTLLNLAGIATWPETKCQIGPVNKKLMYFRVQMIKKEEAEAFLKFLKEVTQDENASLSYVETNNLLDLNNSKNKLEQAYEFQVDKELVYARLFPRFKEQFSTLDKEKLTEYKNESLTDSAIRGKLNFDISDQKSRLNKPLQDFLIPQLISAEHCAIFAETVLQLTGVTREAVSCKTSPIDKVNMQFEFQGIDQDDAKKVEDYFREISDKDYAVDVSLSPITPQTYNCVIPMDIVITYLLPRFENAFPTLSAEKLASYRKQSENHRYIEPLLLQQVFEEIIVSAALLEANCPDAFTKGELHIVNTLLQSFEHYIQQKSRDEVDLLGTLSQAKFAADIYRNMFTNNTVLHNDPAATHLNNKCDEMETRLKRQVEQISIFHLFSGKKVEKAEKHEKESISTPRLV